MASTPAHSGGKFFTAADAKPQGDGSQLYTPGDDPWNEPLLFDPLTGQPIPGQAGANIGPRHAPLVVVGNGTGGFRFENVIDWAPGADPQAAGGGATPQPSAADAAAAKVQSAAQAFDVLTVAAGVLKTLAGG